MRELVKRSSFVFLAAAVLAAAGCGHSSTSVVTATTTTRSTETVTVTVAAPQKPPLFRLPTMRQLAELRANAWWWTPERASYLLEANALRALQTIPDLADWYVDSAECSGSGRGIHYLVRRPLFQQFVCTVSTFVGVSGTKYGPTLTIRVLALTRDSFNVYFVGAGD
jgi:hypothetical protein